MDFLKAAIVEYFVIQVLIQDISCETWQVYLPQKVIGIQGSCVVIPCTFNYPGVEKQSNDITILWYKDNENSQQYTEIYHSKNNLISLADSYILVGDSGKKNCSLKITKLQKKDEEHYHLRVEIAQLGAFSFIKQTAYVSVSGKNLSHLSF
ncbi:Schwann cell myelin protein-like [Protopterus annectens]|uniref:Schwann cell myelin protein-like n=1 Tax=Protopterus annectens TaxID=7888 RepID=UPI001CF98BFF|nr:Schwann cell myelin protein-like [Protopterus annectens]